MTTNRMVGESSINKKLRPNVDVTCTCTKCIHMCARVCAVCTPSHIVPWYAFLGFMIGMIEVGGMICASNMVNVDDLRTPPMGILMKI